jgi:hypothetical protein
LLARDPGAGAERVIDGAGGVFDGGVHVPPVLVVHQSEVAALGAADLGERADVELAVVASVFTFRRGRRPDGVTG